MAETTETDPRRATSARLRGVPPEQVEALFRAEAEEHGLDFAILDERRRRVRTQVGDIELELGESSALVTILAEGEDNLHMLRESVVMHIAEVSAETADGLRWSGSAAIGEAPPNLRLLKVVETTRISPSFIRVRLGGPDIGRFAENGLHFRLLLPPEGEAAPQWPTIGANGQTVWPEGEAALHRPVYTIRWIDTEAGLLDFDVFIHEGGRTTGWARSVAPGAEVGIIGPGGGWHPSANWLLMAGDETALPAMARILENLPEAAEGVAYIQVGGAEDEIALAAPSGVEIAWLHRDQGAPSLAEKMLAVALPERPDRLVWFAGETAEAKRLRAHFRALPGMDRAQHHIAAYWTRDV